MPPSAIALQRRQRHLARLVVAGARVLAEQEQQLARAGKFGRVAKATAPRSKAFELLHGPWPARQAPGIAPSAGWPSPWESSRELLDNLPG
jgi:hypothetical protein